MARDYYTLLTREHTFEGKWAIQFGDYEKAVVEQERKDSYGGYAVRNTKIIKTDDNQASIQEWVDILNKEEADKRKVKAD